MKTKPVYSTGGFASIIINRPLELCFKILTDVNLWPKINVGISKAISPEALVLKEGAKFTELISSPVGGIDDWTNQWTVDNFKLNENLVLIGVDNFARVPVNSRLTYFFAKESENATLFKRSIEVDIDKNFKENASKPEIEALYNFLGSQWEMANHLKNYVESY